jgi:Aromatic-ring-opening dioxygenase LigAB, LigA subunit
MRDYWLSKLFFDLQQPVLAAEFRENPAAVLARYPLDEPVKKAIAEHDVPFLAARTNAYLLRYYFFAVGMKDDEFVRRLREGPPPQVPGGNANG